MAGKQEKMAGLEELWDSDDGNELGASGNDCDYGGGSVDCLAWI